jgi:hypothetical protein
VWCTRSAAVISTKVAAKWNHFITVLGPRGPIVDLVQTFAAL